MFCPRCGTDNANNAPFCEKCGAPMGATYAPAKQPGKGLTVAMHAMLIWPCPMRKRSCHVKVRVRMLFRLS